jgi:hypothetical protein
MTSGCNVSLGKLKTGYDRVNLMWREKRREEKRREERNARELQIASTRSAITQIPTSPQALGDLASTLLFSVPSCQFFPQKLSLKCDCTSFELQLEIVPLAFFQCFIVLFWCHCTQIIVELDHKGNSIHNSEVFAFLQLISFLLMISKPISVVNRVEKLCVVDAYRMSFFLTTAKL